MSTIKLEFPERLKQEKIFSPEQADAFARALNDELTGKLATKSDLAELESRIQTQMLQLENSMQTRMLQLESRMQSRMLQLENKILKWMVGLFLTGTVVNVTVVGLLVSL